MQHSTAKTTIDSLALDGGFTSIMPGGESSTRRQRIAMACQYCRHRKIKCCGSTPCANCTRARRTCDYSPVPEEVNRATREKKAAAKAAKSAFAHRPTPYFVDHQSVYGMPYLAGPGPIRGTHVPPRRAYTTPTMTMSPYSPLPPQAPAMSSPAHFESPWFNGPPVPVISVSPMVPVMPHSAEPLPVPEFEDHHHAYAQYTTAPVSPTESSASSTTQYPMPMTPVRKTILQTPPHTPSAAYFQAATPNMLSYTPQPFPFSPSPLAQSTFQSSPTLCPGLPVQQKLPPPQPQQPLVGLGIGLTAADEGISYIPMANDYLTASNVWTQPEASPYLS
ncbi:putative transcriptional regulatory protein STB4 [Vanrija pseudolonga]|uniref:Transcriptional regulatory protein STB4 n=1 Tax=Vanrija pseudolonga TaxID=143232 RepID=A0AAF0YFA2_9TREE|nr:putative transcriptional regulatory protein STB4 [Vanrija pseudolonga]